MPLKQASSKTQGEPRSPVPQLCLQPQGELRQGAGTACSQHRELAWLQNLLSPAEEQEAQLLAGAGKAGGDHKWKSVVKHGGEHRLTPTCTVPPQKSTPRQTRKSLKLVQPSLDQSRNLIRMHVCSHTQTRQGFNHTHFAQVPQAQTYRLLRKRS